MMIDNKEYRTGRVLVKLNTADRIVHQYIASELDVSDKIRRTMSHRLGRYSYSDEVTASYRTYTRRYSREVPEEARLLAGFDSVSEYIEDVE